MHEEYPVEAPVPVASNDVETHSSEVNPVRSAAGRLGGQRVHQLAELGRLYEQEHGLKAGRQRLKQLVQLGRKFETEHGLKPQKTRRRKKGDAWQEFLAALERVVKPAYRPLLEQLAVVVQKVDVVASGPARSTWQEVGAHEDAVLGH